MKPRDFKVAGNNTSNVDKFGFHTQSGDNATPSPNKSLRFTINLGQGGASLKNLLNTNMERTEEKHRAVLKENPDGTCIILIDPSVPPEVAIEENITPIRRRGRPAKKQRTVPEEEEKEQIKDFTIMIDQDETFQNVSSSDDHQVNIPTRKRLRNTINDSQEE